MNQPTPSTENLLAPVQPKGPLLRSLRFFLEFFKSPIKTGGVWPSSQRLTQKMLAGFQWPQLNTIVELGPGTGAFTQGILNAMSPGTRYLGVETSAAMVDILRARFPSTQFPQVHFCHGSASELRSFCQEHSVHQIDAVISGLPWAWLPAKERASIFNTLYAMMHEGSEFATFAHVHGTYMTGGKEFQQTLQESFSHVETSAVVWSNIPPAFVYHCRR